MNVRVNPNARLTVEQVVSIIKARGITLRELGEKYGVAKNTVSLIRRGITWKRVHRALEQCAQG